MTGSGESACSEEIALTIASARPSSDGRLSLRFKGLDLIDRVPHELWMEVHNIVQETGIKTIPRKRNAKSKMAV